MDILDGSLSIGFDAKRALFNTTGLGNYSRLVVELLAARHPQWRLSLYSPRGGGRADARAAAMLAALNVGVVTPDGALGRAFPSLWRSVAGMGRQAASAAIDLFHGLSGELPPDLAGRGVPTVVTVHDLIFNRCPENYSAIDRRIYNAKFRRAVGQATRVVAISRRTADDIIDAYGTDPAKIDVVYQGCDPLFAMPVAPEAIAAVRKRYGLEGRYIVAVGTVERRKNQELAVKALAKLPADVTLAIVGGDHGDYSRTLERIIAQCGVKSRVKRLRGVPFADLPPLYAGAEFSSYTSRYEGFGLPLIESLSGGTPAIAATGSCLEEAGGPGALYVDPDDVDAYVDAASRLLDDRALRASMAAEGRAWTDRFSPGNFASGLEATYRRALAGVVL